MSGVESNSLPLVQSSELAEGRACPQPLEPQYRVSTLYDFSLIFAPIISYRKILQYFSMIQEIDDIYKKLWYENQGEINDCPQLEIGICF